ncbi:hypothetical protein ElyMa_006393300 [Elysia marginata]|uniref:C-type lectin domain-containing protein n=1 Tax=Elysia marginata TaxID=1093978 RepID=A0AAV4HQ05_9GAST|nr:hypothetical protein ElyMa_006393300 [Elysia marginata]
MMMTGSFALRWHFFNGMCYQINQTHDNFDGAKKTCEGQHSSLADATTDRIRQFIIENKYAPVEAGVEKKG